MEIYLIRHTTPKIEKGICYGQTDLDITDTFYEEMASMLPFIPKNIESVYSSPLQRCQKLAEALFPQKTIQLYNDLMELNCGKWEMQPWNKIPKAEIQPWMDDFINIQPPGGESYLEMHSRVINRFNHISLLPKPAVIVAHGGVLRSILAHITQTSLKESFDVFTCHYGCVVKLTIQNDVITHEMLYNISLAGKEWHRPVME